MTSSATRSARTGKWPEREDLKLAWARLGHFDPYEESASEESESEEMESEESGNR